MDKYILKRQMNNMHIVAFSSIKQKRERPSALNTRKPNQYLLESVGKVQPSSTEYSALTILQSSLKHEVNSYPLDGQMLKILKYSNHLYIV